MCEYGKMYVGSEVLTLSVCDRATEGREITRDSRVYLSITCTNARGVVISNTPPRHKSG